MNKKMLISKLKEIERILITIFSIQKEYDIRCKSDGRYRETLKGFKKRRLDKKMSIIYLIKFLLLTIPASLILGFYLVFILDNLGIYSSINIDYPKEFNAYTFGYVLNQFKYREISIFIQLVASISYFFFRKNERKNFRKIIKNIDSNKKEMELLKKKQIEIYQQNLELLNFINIEYQYLYAVSVFIKDLETGSSRDLSECIKEYKTHLYRERRLKGCIPSRIDYEKIVMKKLKDTVQNITQNEINLEETKGIEFKNECTQGLFSWRNMIKNMLMHVSDDRKEEYLKELSAVDKGIEGEEQLYRELKFCNIQGKAIFNVCLYDKRKRLCTEIDCVIITRGNIFVIEAKNYSYDVEVEENEQFRLIGENKNEFSTYSPVNQNRHHIQILKEVLKEKYKNTLIEKQLDDMNRYKNIVVMTNTNRILSVNNQDLKNIVMRIEKLNKHLEELENESINNEISVEDINNLVIYLLAQSKSNAFKRNRIYLQINKKSREEFFEIIEEFKAKGAKFNGSIKQWYITPDADLMYFAPYFATKQKRKKSDYEYDKE